jgi:tetrahydromethanopterin S-methyltransferase subunit B
LPHFQGQHDVSGFITREQYDTLALAVIRLQERIEELEAYPATRLGLPLGKSHEES